MLAAGPAAANHLISLDKATGLKDGDVITVTGKGETPGKTLTVAQCAESSKGPGACNTLGAQYTTVAADGTFTVKVTMVVGKPFGGEKIVCNAATKCSVGAISLAKPTGPECDRVIISFEGDTTPNPGANCQGPVAAVTTTTAAPEITTLAPTTTAPAPTTAAAPVTAAPTTAAAPTDTTAAATKKDDSSSGGLIIGIVAAVVVLGGGAAFAMSRKKK